MFKRILDHENYDLFHDNIKDIFTTLNTVSENNTVEKQIKIKYKFYNVVYYEKELEIYFSGLSDLFYELFNILNQNSDNIECKDITDRNIIGPDKKYYKTRFTINDNNISLFMNITCHDSKSIINELKIFENNKILSVKHMIYKYNIENDLAGYNYIIDILKMGIYRDSLFSLLNNLFKSYDNEVYRLKQEIEALKTLPGGELYKKSMEEFYNLAKD